MQNLNKIKKEDIFLIVGRTIKDVKRVKVSYQEEDRSEDMNKKDRYHSAGISETIILLFTDGTEISI